jgi:hypothetical protein
MKVTIERDSWKISSGFGTRLYTDELITHHYDMEVETPRLNLSEALSGSTLPTVSCFNRKTQI